MCLTELRIIKRNMYSMMYQEMGSMGAMVIDRELDMFPPNMKNSPVGECLTQNDGGTREECG